MNVPIFTPCEYATIGLGDRPSVVDVFNNIHFAQLPGTHRFSLFARLLAEPGKYPVTITAWRDEAEKPIEIFSAEIAVNQAKAHNVVVSEEFGFDHPGRYEFTFFANQQPLAKTHMVISASETSAAAKPGENGQQKEAPPHEEAPDTE